MSVPQVTKEKMHHHRTLTIVNNKRRTRQRIVGVDVWHRLQQPLEAQFTLHIQNKDNIVHLFLERSRQRQLIRRNPTKPTSANKRESIHTSNKTNDSHVHFHLALVRRIQNTLMQMLRPNPINPNHLHKNKKPNPNVRPDSESNQSTSRYNSP